jgi:hypothetical protein
MTHVYQGLVSFYNAYRDFKFHVTIDDVDELAAELRKHANVRIGLDDRVTVSEYSDKYGPQKRYCRTHFTKLSAAVPRDLAADFSSACKTLGVSQMSVLEPLLKATVDKARDATQS